MLLLAGEAGNSRFAVALDFVRPEGFDQQLAHFAAKILTRCDHRAQVFNLFGRIRVLHNGNHSHFSQGNSLFVSVVHLVFQKAEPFARSQFHPCTP